MDNLTLLSIIGASFSFVIILIKTAYKSKCKTIECCCIKISRDIDVEQKEDMYDKEHNIKDNEDLEAIKNSIK